MRYIGLLVLSLVGVHGAFAQSTGKISYTISNGLQIAGVDGTNPVIYDNDYLMETPEDAFLWLKAHNGEVNLVGNINTRDMYGCESGNCMYTHDFTFSDWTNTYKAVTEMGLKNIPAPIKGASEALTRPSSGRIEDTQYYVSEGSELILREARKASPSKPLLVLIGGNPTSVANAYLKDPSIADRIIVFHVDGWRGHGQYNMTDSWGTYVVMKKLMYIMWDGDLTSWYDGKNVGVTNEMIAGMPVNPLTNSNKFYWDNVHSIWHDFGDGPVVLYLFDHSLWKNVQRRTENNQATTGNDYDYLIISENDWQNYGPVYFDYMNNADNYLVSTSTNVAPVVNLTAPSNNASYTQGSSITITATATDANGSIARVEFYSGSTKLAEDVSSPYSYTWNGAAAGNHSITTKAIDNEGASTTSGAVSISVTAPNTNPAVNITSPENNATYSAGVTVSIAATATDTGGSISKVEFFNGTTKLGEDLTSPYSFTWSNAPIGNHSILAKATDNQGAVTNSTTISLLVIAPNTPPVVTITSPTNSTSYAAGAAIAIAAAATDANGSVVRVEFFNGATKLGEDVTSPFSISWANAPVGTHTLTAKATDNQNLTVTSPLVAVSVVALPGAPLVSMTSPVNNSSIEQGTSITLSATASQSNGSITKVEFFDGGTKLGEDLVAPYSIVWSNAAAGTHSLSAKATDTNNLTATSAPSVTTVIAPNVPPVVNIVTPGNKATFNANASVNITASATDPNGSVSKVEFFSGSVKLGEDLTSPYNFNWASVSPGIYVIVAKATDNQGMSAAHQIQVTVNPANKVPLASAGDDITTHLPAESVLIHGTGSDPEEGVITFSWTQVSGPQNASFKQGTDGELQVSNLSEGSYVFELAVTDKGDLTTKDQMILLVLSPNTLLGQVPRYFTPNNDGMNDFWEWPSIELYENALLTIFNRVGQKVFETTSYQNNWNGNMDGRQLQSDAYYYIIKLGNTALKGAVRIVR